MNFDDTPQEAAFRAEARAWIQANAPKELEAELSQPTVGRIKLKNRDILEQLIVARDARRAAGLPDVVLEHVRGHRGHVLNEWADERAVRAAEHAAQGKESAWSSLGGLHPQLDVAAAPAKKAR